MYADEYEEKIVIQKVPITEVLICDECKKTIYKRPYGARLCGGYVNWYEVTTGHNDWGNDSVDSIERRQICPDCLPKVFAEYHDQTKDMGMGSDYIEIHHYYRHSEVQN